MRYVVALIVALILNATANLFMKVGMQSVAAAGDVLKDGVAAAVKTIATNGVLVIGLAFFLLNAAFYMYALQSKTLKISIAYPIMVGGGYALIALVARFHPALEERLTWGQALGVALVLIGVLLIAVQTNPASRSG
jgi:small multidrug resistance pump